MSKKLNRPEFLPVNEDDLKPYHKWHRPLQAPGTTQVDFEERIDFRRLHRYRLARTREALGKSGLGAMLCFDQYNIRYISSTVIGEWARDKLIRYCLLTGTGEPWVWDFGSAARHHRIYCPWLHEDHVLAGNPGMRGAIGPEVGLFKQAAKEIKSILEKEGVADMPLGLDICEPAYAVCAAGRRHRSARRSADDARRARNQESRRDHAPQHRFEHGGWRVSGHRG
jgi:Xaa-Pro dipeptidase